MRWWLLMLPCCLVIALTSGCGADCSRRPVLEFDDDQHGDAVCVHGPVVHFQGELDLMAWPRISRTNLSYLRSEGIVVVRYEVKGCEVKLELIPDCIGLVEYGYAPYSRSETKLMSNRQELVAELPLGATRLKGPVDEESSLRVDTIVVGTATLPTTSGAYTGNLEGPGCQRATHVISRMELGGFGMASGSRAVLQAQSSVFLAEAATRVDESMVLLGNEGDAEACAVARKTGREQSLCDVPLRVRLLPLQKAEGVPTRQAPSGVASSRQVSAPTSKQAGTLLLGEMKPLPGGGFLYGEKKESRSVGTFELDVTEVTVAAYQACVDAGICTVPKSGERCNWGRSGREEHPINCVDWEQANGFCSWAGKRLPTEEEWEYAARGNAGRTYPWGETAPSRTKLCLDRGDGTCSVCSRPSGSTPSGLCDMAGNVWEWTSASEEQGRIMRGGSLFSYMAAEVRSASRKWGNPKGRVYFLGFRCAR
jgi:formylglycine-generating enzyme required for sulfatase activity